MAIKEATALRHKLLKNDVFNVLHERIIAGEYAPGAWLRQEELSAQLGVSMTPVREALDMLVSSGIAERIPYRGVQVLRLSSEEIADAYVMRLLLESIAAYTAASCISSEQLKRATEILEQSKPLVTLEDMSNERVLNRELHETIVAASGNSLLYKTYVTVFNTFPDWMLYEYMFRHPELLKKSMAQEYKEHQMILKALVIHDTKLAMQRTIEHITNRGKELQTYLKIPQDIIAQKENQVLPLLVGYTKP
jgi:DNA-binding GntR family transcriptional regulator